MVEMASNASREPQATEEYNPNERRVSWPPVLFTLQLFTERFDVCRRSRSHNYSTYLGIDILYLNIYVIEI